MFWSNFAHNSQEDYVKKIRFRVTNKYDDDDYDDDDDDDDGDRYNIHSLKTIRTSFLPLPPRNEIFHTLLERVFDWYIN